ncbi:unnamed protein product [Trichobilharzia szidati]|nr:unnamed protein product [Trichobilharzia szidati]
MASPGLKRRTSNTDPLNSTVTTSYNPVRAFYELPEGKPTAAQIVKESRDWLRSVSTCRPFTPKDKTRSLFGVTSQTRTRYRPSSSFKVTANCFDPYESTVKSSIQLEPIDTKSKNIQKQPKCSKSEISASLKKSSKKQDDRIRDYNIASQCPSLGLTDESTSTGGRKSSPRLELIGTQTRLISPINVKRPAYLSVKTDGSNIPKFSNTNVVESPRISNTPQYLANKLEEGNKIKGISSKISPVLPNKYSCTTKTNMKASTNSFCRSPSQVSTLSSLDDNQSPRPNSPAGLHLLPNRTAFIAEEDKYHLRSNGVRSAVISTSIKTELTKTLIDENKPKSSGPHTKHQRQVNYNINKINLPDKFQTSASGDSGLSSGTELDHLIYQLSELSFSPSSSPNVAPVLLSPLNIQNPRTPDLEILFEDNKSVQPYHEHKGKSDEIIPLSKCTVQQEDENDEDHSTFIFNKLDEDKIIDLLNRITSYISEFGLEGNQNSSSRSTLLKSVFDLINYPSSRLHLTIAKLVFSMNVVGRNLSNICKIVYRVAKDPDNDYLFLENSDTLDTLIGAMQLLDVPVSSISSSSSTPCQSFYSSFTLDNLLQNSTLFCLKLESLLFVTGTIKFLISNVNFMEKFHSIPKFLQNLMILHQQIFELSLYLCNNAKYQQSLCTTEKEDNSNDSNKEYVNTFIQHSYHILMQVTEIFCYLSSMDSFRPKLMVHDGILEHIVNCIISYHEYIRKQVTVKDIQSVTVFSFSEFYTVYFNWIRCLSHLTEHADVCHHLENWLISVKDNVNLYANDKHENPLNISKTVLTRITTLCQTLMYSLYFYKENEDLVVRIVYVLGNLAARCERARVAILPNQESLLKLCEFCRQYNSPIPSKATDHSATDENSCEPKNVEKGWTMLSGSNSNLSSDCATVALNKSNRVAYTSQYDILVKLLRIIANVTISDTVGFLCTTNFDCINLILEITENQHTGEPNELLLNCFACLNNLTYYIKNDLTEESVIKQCEIAESLLRAMNKTSGYQDEFLGIIRVFGNLTRHSTIRQWLNCNSNRLLQVTASNRGPLDDNDDDKNLNELGQQNAFLYLLIQALDSSRPDLVYSTLGVLINLMTDIEQRPMLRTLEGLPRLLEILRDFAGHDWQLAGLSCKALWNYTELVGESFRELFDPEIMNELFSLLTEFTDTNIVTRIHNALLSDSLITESDCLTLWEAAWSTEFLPVAKDLLHRLSNA